MKIIKDQHTVSTALAVTAGFVMGAGALPAGAATETDNPEVTALTQPANSVEIGARKVSDASAKFGEYNGLDDSSLYLIGNFDLRGGDAYNAYAGGMGTHRWEIRGSDLGTTSRSLSATASDQSRWRVGARYDELRHYSTDSYQTPYIGAPGSNVFELPLSFGVIAADRYGDAFTGAQGLTAGQQAAFHTQRVYSGRRNMGLNAGYNFNRQVSLQFDFNRLEQTGAKLLAASFSPDASGAGAGENSATFLNPNRYQTDTFEAALLWTGDQWHLRSSYFASLFHDDYAQFSFANPFSDPAVTANGDPPEGGVYPVNVYGTAPNNTFQQLNLSGGYAFSSATSLAGGLSYGRNTQDSHFINDPLLIAPLPRASLDGRVLNTHADLKLTHQATHRLVLTAGFKYNERDNQTHSSVYGPFNSVAGDPFGTVVSAPVSNRKTQFELAGNLHLDRRQNLVLAYEHEAIRRWCNSAEANNAQSSDPEAPLDYYTQAACVQVGASKEDKLSANYRFKASNAVRLTAGYAHNRRRADVNASYYNPMQASGEGFQNYGFVGYFDATRTEQIGKLGINWQAADALSMGLAFRYVDNNYDSALGVQSGSTKVADLDIAYSLSPDASLAAYVTLQRRARDMLSAEDRSPTAPPTQIWSNRLKDDSDTIGLTAKRGGLMHGKLQIVGDASFASGKSVYATNLLNYDSPMCTSTIDIACGELPAIRNELLRVRLSFQYQASKSGAVAFVYHYQKLKSNDYYYSAYQFGSNATTVLPTNQREPSYTVNVLGLSYIYSFR